MVTDISGLETEQRHSSYSQSRDGHFACFPFFYRLVVIIQKLYDNQFRLEVATVKFITFGKRGLHFGRCVGGVKLQGIPFLVYPFTQCVQGEIGIAECFAYAYAFLHGAVMVINMILFSKFNEFDEERRNYHATRGMDAPDSVPLQFGNAVSHTGYPHAQLTGSHIVGEACHETSVDGGHQL